MDMFKDILFNPFHENRDFKCDICNKYLSIAPILFHKSVGKLCGRCFERGETTEYSDVTFETQTVYEKIAKHIIFPCSFQAKGCKKRLEWDQVSKHEDECDFRENKCPFGQDALIFEGKKCDWIGDNKNLICHLKGTHSEYFNDSIKISSQIPNRTGSKILISEFMDITVIAILFISEAPNVAEESSNIYFHLFMVPFSDDYTYDLEVCDEKGKHKMVFPENRIDPLCERVFTAFGLKYGFNLDIAGLEALLRSDSLNFWFKIKSKQPCLSGEKLGINPKQQTIFKHRCVTCKQILIDPIHVCYNGHNNCHNCFRKLMCKCEAKINDRNQFLENLSNMSLYECENKDQGCSELVLPENFEFHKQTCKLTDKKCIIAYEDCKWVGNNVGMLYHLTEDHSANKINLNEDYSLPAMKRTQKLFFTVFNGIIFVISIYINPNVSVRVHYFNSETSIYRYEFSITTGKLKLRCSQYCIQWTEARDNLWRYPYIHYPLDFLKEFLEDRSEFNFRVNIFS